MANNQVTDTSNPAPSVARVAAAVKEQLGELWLPQLYEAHIKSKRTRAIALPVPARLNETEILHTLLGIELRVGRRRIACPDLATARYLTVFARMGCKAAAVPYDITQVSHLADELESAWQRMALLAREATPDTSAARLIKLLARQIREEVEASGAGPAMPEFNQNTKQRRF
jgi:hypothetical protein